MASQQKALIIPSKQAPFEIKTRDVPKPGPGQLLVKVISASLNPVDAAIQMLGIIVTEYPAVTGRDAAGIVEEVGTGVTGFSKGDKVLHQGGQTSDYSSFQHYSLVPAELAAKIPDNVTFDQAATFPLCLATAVCGMYNEAPHGLGLAYAWEDGGRGKYTGQPFFVYAGSTTVGQFAIQLAKLSGFSPIITTASLHNTELLMSAGATHVLDRNLSSDAIIAEIIKITSEPIKYAYHAFMGAGEQVTYDLIASGGGIAWVTPEAQYLPVKKVENKDVQFVFIFASFYLPQNKKLGLSLYAALTGLLAEGSIKPTPVEVVPDGLAGIPTALQKLAQRKVSGTKLIAHPQETV